MTLKGKGGQISETNLGGTLRAGVMRGGGVLSYRETVGAGLLHDGSCATDIFDAGAAGHIRADWLEQMEDVVRWTDQAGVKVLRNMNGTATPHGNGLKTSDFACGSDYIGNATARALWFDTLQFIATRYRRSRSIAWLEPASEPHLTHVAPDPAAPTKPWQPCHTSAEVNALSSTRRSALFVPLTRTPPLPSLPRATSRAKGWTSLPTKWPYGTTTRCTDIGKVKAGKLTGSAACVSACQRGGLNASFTYNKSTVAALYSSARAFRAKHKVPLWVDQLMCPPGVFRRLARRLDGGDRLRDDALLVVGLESCK